MLWCSSPCIGEFGKMVGVASRDRIAAQCNWEVLAWTNDMLTMRRITLIFPAAAVWRRNNKVIQ
jgi:hypothetical protein